MKNLILPLALAVLAPSAFAQDVDPASLYTVSTQGSSTSVKPQQKGSFILAITPKTGAHVSDEAPLKLELSGKNVSVGKDKLTLADSVTKKGPGEQYASPRFEVPFVAERAGAASVDAKLTFFICTDKLCSRQQKNLSVPVQVK